jgi:phosphomannomutase
VIWPTIKVCEQHGAQPLISKSATPSSKIACAKRNAIFAGEMSAHYYFRENFYADNGVIPFLLVLEQLSRTGKSFSETMRPYMKVTYMSGELELSSQDAKQTIAKVKEHFAGRGEEDLPTDSR